MSELEITLTDATFDDVIQNSEVPVLVDFWAPWCGPCHMIAPSVEAIAKEYEGKLKVGKMNTDENPLTPQKFGIRGIPTLIFFKNGEEVDRVVGVQPKPILVNKVEDLM